MDSRELKSPEKHVLIFLDIDDTLIDFSKSNIMIGPDGNPLAVVKWLGANKVNDASGWLFYLKNFKEQALKKGIIVHFIPNTFREKSDAISDEVINVLRDVKLIETVSDEVKKTLTEDQATKLFGNNLAFFVGKGGCKVKQGMDVAKQIIEKEAKHTHVLSQDLWMLDDQFGVYLAATAKYKAVLAQPVKSSKEEGFLQLDLHGLWKSIYTAYDLEIPKPILAVEPELFSSIAGLFSQKYSPSKLSFSAEEIAETPGLD